MIENGNVDTIVDGFTKVLMTGFTPDYMEVALKHLREWAKAPNTREDVREFLSKTEDVPDEAIVALSSKSVALLTSDEGTLVAFA